jgi:hypothetical protein
MTELSDLPVPARARLSLDLAGDAQCEAADAEGPLRESCVLIAEQWEKMAVALTDPAMSGLERGVG